MNLPIIDLWHWKVAPRIKVEATRERKRIGHFLRHDNQNWLQRVCKLVGGIRWVLATRK